LLQEYHWPGNVRELENTIERAVVLTTGSTITRDAVTVEGATITQTPGVPSLNLRRNVQWIECETIRRALELSTEKQGAARLLGITPRALSYYLAKFPLIRESGAGRAQTSKVAGASDADLEWAECCGR
jgi:transcriptional regulator with PAS, ATPase and Fis domain